MESLLHSISEETYEKVNKLRNVKGIYTYTHMMK